MFEVGRKYKSRYGGPELLCTQETPRGNFILSSINGDFRETLVFRESFSNWVRVTEIATAKKSLWWFYSMTSEIVSCVAAHPNKDENWVRETHNFSGSEYTLLKVDKIELTYEKPMKG